MIQVSCALLLHQQRVLIAQRASHMRMPYKWEFPGGKRENDESLQTCLQRELKEELGIVVQVHDPLEMVEHAYPDFIIQLFPFWCTWLSGHLIPSEHAELRWCQPSDLSQYDWADADWPIVRAIQNLQFPCYPLF